ncbi:hypothetical protein QUB70_32535, partial [Microcoleus sp. A003_D6]|uniref:hypothetical protein n=1 Tax=Microcoleus sp. A003_D6 TaxID=3055266 RepID=UPI002FD330DA
TGSPAHSTRKKNLWDGHLARPSYFCRRSNTYLHDRCLHRSGRLSAGKVCTGPLQWHDRG